MTRGISVLAINPDKLTSIKTSKFLLAFVFFFLYFMLLDNVIICFLSQSLQMYVFG